MSNPLAKIAEVAERYVGIKEITPNRAPELVQFWNATDYPSGMDDRQPWCAAFVSFCVQQADRESFDINLKNPPRFASVAKFVNWANNPKSEAVLFGNALRDGFLPMRGDLVSFIPFFSHIGIVAQYDPVKNEVTTIEGNTSPSSFGSQREGDGVWRKVRPLSICGSFIRIAVTAKLA